MARPSAHTGVLRADRVAAAGAVLALAAMFMLPMAVLRPNRIAVEHTPIVLARFAEWGFILPALAVLALAFSFWPRAPWRGTALKALAALLFVALAWALGATASRVLAAQHDSLGYARVSVGAGAWLVVVGAAMIDFASRKREYSGRWIRLSLNLVTVAGILGAAMWGGLLKLSIFVEYQNQTDLFWSATVQHIFLSLSGLALGAAIGIPLGILAARSPAVRSAALGITGVFQTVPSLALLGLLVVPLGTLAAAYPFLQTLGIQGIGAAPAIIALTVYALLPIVRNTHTAMTQISRGMKQAALSLGMTAGTILQKIELPLAAPTILAGIKTSAVINVGTATIAAFIGAGGYGERIVTGLALNDHALLLAGAVPAAVLALLIEGAFRLGERWMIPAGLRRAS